MKYLWMLVLLFPVLMSGCLLLPNNEPHKQTVQKGTPPPVDPNLPGAAIKKPSPDFPRKGAVQPSLATFLKDAPAPITASQVNHENANESASKLWDELDWDEQSNIGAPAGKTATPPWPK